MTQEMGEIDREAIPGTQESLPERIIRRMGESGGFPALDHSVAMIVEALELGQEDTTPLVNAVLADVSLTQKVLRLANSAMYAPIGSSVSTVSHAVHVLGFEAVGHLALGVKLIGSMGQISANSNSAERELAHSLVAGSVAGSVAGKSGAKNGEMGVVCSLLHRLGRLLVSFYLPEEWSRIQHAVETGQEEAEAAQHELGMNLHEVGIHVARQWRLPAKIVRTMQTEGAQPEEEGDDWLLALTHFADQSASLLTAAKNDASSQAMEALAGKFSAALGMHADDLLQAAKAATDEATSEPLLASILVEKKAAPAKPVPVVPADPLARLRVGVRDVRQAIDEQESALEIQRMVLEVAFTALDLSRAAVLLNNQATQAYQVSVTLASRTPNRLVGFSMPAKAGADLAHVALARKVDIYIDNPRDPKIAPHFPDWIRVHSLHPFFLLPMTGTDGQPLGLLYGQQQEDVKLSKEELGQLAALRDLLQGRLRSELKA